MTDIAFTTANHAADVRHWDKARTALLFQELHQSAVYSANASSVLAKLAMRSAMEAAWSSHHNARRYHEPIDSTCATAQLHAACPRTFLSSLPFKLLLPTITLGLLSDLPPDTLADPSRTSHLSLSLYDMTTLLLVCACHPLRRIHRSDRFSVPCRAAPILQIG